MSQHVTTVAVDLAKDIFQLAYGDGAGRVLRRQRLSSRLAFAREMGQWRDVVVVMESCASERPDRHAQSHRRLGQQTRKNLLGDLDAWRCV